MYNYYIIHNFIHVKYGEWWWCAKLAMYCITININKYGYTIHYLEKKIKLKKCELRSTVFFLFTGKNQITYMKVVHIFTGESYWICTFTIREILSNIISQQLTILVNLEELVYKKVTKEVHKIWMNVEHTLLSLQWRKIQFLISST
jgi:hypothetical protein